MKRGLRVSVAILVGFFCLSLGDSSHESGISWSEAFCLSAEQERKLGEEVAAEIAKHMEIIQAPAIQGYIDNIGSRVLSNADRSEFTIRFTVIRESQPNAFAIPGGRIYITSGLIMLVDSEGELAGVMSHEIAHVVRRHIAQRIEASKRINLATLAGALAGILVGGAEGGAIMTGSLALGESQKLKYTRGNESEADRLGLAYMVTAGYDRRQMISFFKKLTRTPEYNAAFPSYLSTHPGVPERISYLESLMGPVPDSTPSDGPSEGLRDVKLRLSIIEKGPLEALSHFDSLLEARPADTDALFGRALAEKEMGRTKDAIEDLKRAHTLKPADPQILKELGLAFIRFGRINEGVRALERSLSLSAEDPETLQYLGLGYQAQKRLDLAIDSYLRARKLGPDLPELDRNLGSAYQEKGEMGRAHLYYGLYFKRRGQVKYARFHLEKARELLGQDAQEQEDLIRELEQFKK